MRHQDSIALLWAAMALTVGLAVVTVQCGRPSPGQAVDELAPPAPTAVATPTPLPPATVATLEQATVRAIPTPTPEPWAALVEADFGANDGCDQTPPPFDDATVTADGTPLHASTVSLTIMIPCTSRRLVTRVSCRSTRSTGSRVA